MSTELPRFVVAAPASGHGKTTVATGLMLALRRAGLRVSGHKVGPDYIDPGYHALATGRPGRNLDPHLVGEDQIVPLLLHGAGQLDGTGRGAGHAASSADAAADVAVIEGVMGLYDGHIGGDGFASTAHVATLTAAPVILVVDISHASRSIAAVVLGMATYQPGIRIAGIVLNKAGSQRHSDEVRRALAPLGIPVLGVVHRDHNVSAPSRHLGLVPAAERPEAARSLDHLAGKVAAAIDLEAVMRIARSAPPLVGAPWSAAGALAEVRDGSRGGAGGEAGGAPGAGLDRADDNADDNAHPLIAVAGGRAFTFRYTETVELLEAAGCSVAPFDPVADDRLPGGTAGIYLGGGFPEVHATELGANEPMRTALGAAVAAGTPTVAECAGMLYLCRSLDGSPMVGAIPADAAMASGLTLAYRRSTAASDNVLAAAGTEVTGHEFHRTMVTPAAGSGPGPGPGPAPCTAPAWTSPAGPEGFAGQTLHASYLHTHWAGHPALAVRFAARARRYSRRAVLRT